MYSSTLGLIALSLLLLAGCGRTPDAQFSGKMSRTEAVDTLAYLPPDHDTDDPDSASAAGLQATIQDLVASGKVKLSPKTRAAVSTGGKLNLSSLSTLLSLLAQNPDLANVAGGMVDANGGSATKAKFSLDSIVLILQALMPVIAVFAPQYAAVIQAVLVVIPSIKAIIAMFKKPAPTAQLVRPDHSRDRLAAAISRRFQWRVRV